MTHPALLGDPRIIRRRERIGHWPTAMGGSVELTVTWRTPAETIAMQKMRRRGYLTIGRKPSIPQISSITNTSDEGSGTAVPASRPKLSRQML